MKKILILGANGQLGNELQVVFNSAAENVQLLCPSVQDLDISNETLLSSYFENNSFDLVINCAAYTAVDKAEEEKELNNAINHLAVKYLAELCEKYHRFLIHISTDFVFDGKKHIAYTENDTTNPLQEYGRAKRAGEQWVKQGIVIRTSWLYSSFGQNFVKTMMRLAETRDSLNVIDNQIGTPCYAADLAQAIFIIISDNSYQNNTGIYHFSNEGVASWYDFASSIMEYANLDCTVYPIPAIKYPTPAKRPSFSVMDKTKIKETFQLTIPNWRSSLKKCIKLINE